EGEGRAARQDADGRGDEIGPEADARDAIGVVLEIEREDGDEPRQHHDAPPVLGHLRGHLRHARARLHPALHRAAHRIASDEEGQPQPDGGSDPDIDRAPDRPEGDAAEHRDGQAGHEKYRGQNVPRNVDGGRQGAVALDPLLELRDVLEADQVTQPQGARRDDAGRDQQQEDDRTDPAPLHRVHLSQAAKSRLTLGVSRVRLNMSPSWRMASAWVGYGWMTEARRPSPMPADKARVSSLIISPACRATMVAPTILSPPFRTCTFTKPSSSWSAMARSTSEKGRTYVSTAIP